MYVSMTYLLNAILFFWCSFVDIEEYVKSVRNNYIFVQIVLSHYKNNSPTSIGYSPHLGFRLKTFRTCSNIQFHDYS
jgi:hypothetical protein